jgi:hypothetical protein
MYHSALALSAADKLSNHLLLVLFVLHLLGSKNHFRDVLPGWIVLSIITHGFFTSKLLSLTTKLPSLFTLVTIQT